MAIKDETKYGFNVDDIIDDLWHELQKVSDDSGCHQIIMYDETKVRCANRLAVALIPFFVKQLEEIEEEDE